MKLFSSLLAGIFLTLSVAGFSSALEIGELDPSFGYDGRVATAIGHYEDQAYAVVVQPDGRILVAGSSSNGLNFDFALVRYEQDGSMDMSFNIDGTVTTQVGRDDDEIAALAVQEDGYIIAAGYSVTGTSRDFALARYTPEGELDQTFGRGGVVVTDYSGMDDEITALAVDREGRIVTAGYTTGTKGRAVVIARYLSNGELDFSFGYEGMSLTGIGDDALARSIDVDDQDRIVVGGSYYFEQRTEVMVLRFTDDGELDSDFGTDGLAVSSYIQSSTDGYGIKVHDSGAILVAGSVGVDGELDASLFLFDGKGNPEVHFGDLGMLVTEVSQEDDMALAVDVRDDVITLSGFADQDGEREFLFISHRVEIPEVDRVSFSLKTGSSTTSLMIGERQVFESYNEFEAESINGSMELVQTVINTTPFGYSSEDISYAVDLQPDGRAVAAGFTEQGGVTSIAVARYGTAVDSQADTVAGGSVAEWLVTTEPYDVNKTGAMTGGTITTPPDSVDMRGVVFSIDPFPTFGEGTDTPDDGDGTDTTPPVISSGVPSGELDAGTSTTTLGVTTNESAICKYSQKAGTPYDSMSLTFAQTGGTSHQETLTGLADGTSYIYYVRCEDAAGNQNNSDFSVSFSVASGAAASGLLRVERYAESLGSIFVSTAHAQTDIATVTEEETASTGGVFQLPKTGTGDSVFDLSTDPFLTEGKTEDGSGVGSFTSELTGLQPGTQFYVRAYAKIGQQVFYGDQKVFKTADSCFIATAAYGSLFHPYVQILRDFRDKYLVSNLPGQIFVSAYYRFSPPAADFISRHPIARRTAQVGLLPVVGLGWLFMQFGASVLLIFGALLICGVWVQHAWLRKNAV